MKKNILFLVISLFCISTTISYSQNVGITDNGATFSPDASSVLELKSTSRGVLVPRMTTAQRTGISGPGVGLMVYDTDTKSFWYYDVAWKEIINNSNNISLGTAPNYTKIESDGSLSYQGTATIYDDLMVP